MHRKGSDGHMLSNEQKSLSKPSQRLAKTIAYSKDITRAGDNVVAIPKEFKKEVRDLSLLVETEIEEREGVAWQRDDFEMGRQVGWGAFGRVFLVIEKRTRLRFALKEVKRSQLDTPNLRWSLLKEIRIHKLLNHPNIIPLYTYFTDNANVYLVLEYAAHGTILDLLHSQISGCFTEQMSAKYTYQVSDALNYCHSMGIVHRDVKPENLLVDVRLDLKLSDFGWASIPACSHTMVRECGTSDYFSPEVVEGRPYGESVDRWSVGVLTYEMLAGEHPFKSNDADTVSQRIVTVNYSLPEHFSAGAKHLISQLIVFNPLKRLRFERVMTHPWILSNYSPVASSQSRLTAQG